MSGRLIAKYLKQITSPKPWLNGFPACPALVGHTDEVYVFEYNDDKLYTTLDTWLTLKPFSVIFYSVGATETWLDQLAEGVEEKYPHIAALWAHPAHPRYVGKNKMPSPEIPILILQSRQALDNEKKRLRELGYYKAWKQ